MLHDRIVFGCRLEEARQSFYTIRRRYNGRAHSFQFEFLLRYFDNPTLTLKEIAKETRIDESCLGRIYRTHFQHLYGNKSWPERYRIHNHVEAVRDRVRFEEFLNLSVISHFYRSAIAAGHTVMPVTSQYERSGRRPVRHVLRRVVAISGHRAMIFPITGVRVESLTTRWAHVIIPPSMLQDCEYCIFPVFVKRAQVHTLVIPTKTLGEIFGNSSSERWTLKIPLHTLPKRTMQALSLDPRLYNNNWGLIPAPHSTSARH